MKCKYIAGIIAIAASVVIFKRNTVFAEQLCLVQGTGNGEMTVEQMLQSYEWYSGAGKQVRSDLYLAALEEQGARAGKAEAESDAVQIQVLLLQSAARKEQSESAKKELEALYQNLLEKAAEQGLSKEELEQKTELEKEISKFKEEIAIFEEQMAQLEVQKTEREFAILTAQLGWEQKAFYTENRDNLAGIRMKSLNYTLLSKVLNLALLQKEQEYYDCCEELLNLKKKVNEVRQSYGISVKEIEEKELLIEEKRVKGNVAAVKKIIDRTVDEIAEETGLGNKSLFLSYQVVWNVYDGKTVANRFLENSEMYLQLEYYQNMYREYVQGLPQSKGQIKEQASALIENYEIKEELNRKQLETYAKETLSAYDEAEGEFSIAEKNCEVCKNNYFAECKKIEYGCTTKQSVLESRAELMKAELNYLQCVIEKIRLEYLLENGIEVRE